MKQRLGAATLIICILFTLMPGIVFAQGDTGWYDSSATDFTVNTAEELAGFADLVNSGISFSGKTVRLGQNIDLGGYTWTPIGNDGNTFQGTFDGQNHIIYHLKINTTERYCGLFGKASNAVIRRLGIEGADIQSTANDAAVLLGNAQGGTIEMCYVTGSVKGRGAVSGILGSTHSSSYPTTVQNCYARVALNNTGYTSDIAGISGWNEATSVVIKNCFSACTGEVRPIAGWSDGSSVNNSQFENTYFDKTLSPDFSDSDGRADLGKTSEDLQKKATYTDWDFAEVWAIDESINGGYPYLQGFTPGLGGAPGSISVAVKDADDNPVTNADVYITNGSENVPLNHQGNGIYSGMVETKDATYDLYVNKEKKDSFTQGGSGAVVISITVEDAVDDGYTNWTDAGNAAVLDTDYTVDSDGNYTVMTALGLAKIANLVNGEEELFAGKTVVLNQDIDLLDAGVIGYSKDSITIENSWNPIGTLSYDLANNQVTVVPFLGVFDGNGYSVKNLYMNYPDVFAKNTGLFGSALSDFNIGGQCTIKNVTIEGAKIEAGFPLANSFLVGMAADTAISGCTVDETSEMTVLDDTVQLNGGIAGAAQESTLDLGGDTLIENCTNNGTISGGMLTGGIVGGTGQKIVGCTNNGNITAKIYAGGIAGQYAEDNGRAPFEILNCTNTGNITTTNSWAGGIAGNISLATETGLIANCCNSGIISAGGDAGGIGGTSNKIQIQNCYNIGEVKGQNDLGGIVGYQYADGSIENCYSSGTVTGESTDSIGALIGLNAGTAKNLYSPQDAAAIGTASTGTAENIIGFDGSNTLSSEITIGEKKTTVLSEALNYYLDYVLMNEVYYSWKDTEATPVFNKPWTEPPKEVGPFIVSGGVEGQDYKYTGVFDETHKVDDNVLTVLTNVPLSITANSTVTTARIAIADGVNADITLNNLKIDLENNNGSALAIPSGSSLKLTVVGDNLLRSFAAGPGILVDNGAELEINGTNTDVLEVYGAQIDSYYDGELSGGYKAGFAGIGGQNSSKAYNYTGKITINGGTVMAHGYGYGAGIGGGDYGSGGIITINGGIITATTGEGLPDGWISSSTANASGIGASQGQPGGTILITGGTVKASGGYGCAGIGGGTADVTITGGNVTAYGGPMAAGIGGYNQNKGNIMINIGADATVTAYSGDSGGCGIGQGSNTTASTTLNIEKGAKVIAFSKENANRPAVTAVSNSAENPANMVNAYITNMTLPFDVPITAVLGNETVDLTIPAGTGGVAFTTEAAGEFIAKTSVAVGGITYQFIPVDNSKATVTSGNTLTKEEVKAVTAAEFSKEETPNAQIDYENGRLNGVTPGAKYRLSYEGAPDGYYLDLTADEEGNLTHDMFSNFYGKKVSVIKLGNGETTLNSDPQWLSAKNLQSALNIETVSAKIYGDKAFSLNVTGGSGTGVITYAVSMGNNIEVDENGRVTILGAGESTVTVTKAEDDNYAAISQNTVITVNPRPVNIVWNGTENLVYDGTEKAISAEVSNLVSGDTVNLTFDGTMKATEKGSYTAAVTAVDNGNYTLENATNLEKNWSISETQNEWTEELTITGWTYGESANIPAAEAKHGTVVFTYSDSEDGGYTEAVPQNAGTYWVKAAVPGTESYAEISAKQEFVIAKAVPVLAEAPAAMGMRQGNALSESIISGGVVNGVQDTVLAGTFAWQDGTEAMNTAGSFTRTVVFTPADQNYTPIETQITVNVNRPSSGGGISGGSSVTRYTVTFDPQGGSETNSIQVLKNSMVSKPSNPSKEGYTFAGWFTDKDGTQAFDFATKITKNLTLYAKWAEQGTEPTKPPVWENPFTDVQEDDWFYNAVQYAYQNGLFSGMTETAFAPNEAITRGMMVTVLWRMENKPVVNYLMSFGDVDSDAYYTEAVRWAASEQIVKGYSDTEFAPDQLITREEMAAVIQRYVDNKGMDTGAKGDLMQFADQAEIADWARENVAWAVGSGLISGKGDGVLDPQGNTTRAEAAAILQRLLANSK